jgi:hypothetical protein
MPAIITTQLTRQQMQAIQDALRKYTGQVSAAKLKEILDGIKGDLTNLLNPQQQARAGMEQTVTVGMNSATFDSSLAALLQKNGIEAIAEQIAFTRKIATEVAQGAGNYVRANAADTVEAYPGWELLRVYDRMVPRGFKIGPKGELVEDPEDAWPARWRAAAEGLDDEDAIIGTLETTGRMIALKNSDIWQRLGDGAGGYDDTLGNPFPPFAFNSGFDVNEVSDKECVDFGLLGVNEQAEPASIDFGKLFSPVEEAA